RCDGVDVSLCSFFRDTGFQSTNNVITVIAATLRKFWSNRNRSINLGAFWIIETLGHHSHDRASNVVYGDRLVEDVGIGSEASLPQTVCDYRNCILAGLILFFK